jgi:hypothetical protein
MPVGAAVRVRAVFEQEERHVVVAVTAGAPVRRYQQRIQRVAVGRESECDQ